MNASKGLGLVFGALALFGAIAIFSYEAPLPPVMARVEGRLTLDGRPLEAGHAVVLVEPVRGDLVFGTTDREGNFVVNSARKIDVVPGRYRACIKPPAAAGGPDDPVAARFSGGDVLRTKPIVYPLVYADPTTTPLEFRIEAGPNRLEIDLRSDVGAPSTAPASPESSAGS